MKYDLNIKDNYAELIFNHPKYGKLISYIDMEDYIRIKNKTLHISYSKNEYRLKFGNGEMMHRYIMNCPKEKVVDHINHNSLDNRKENLRICTQAENQKNRKLSKNNKTGYSGIRLDKRYNSYLVEIGKDKHYIGSFKNIEDAVTARNKYLKEHNYIIQEVESEG